MANIKNEKLKRNYFKWLRNAKGFSESTVIAKERDIHRWEEYTNYEDFGRFTVKKAVAFKQHLEEVQDKGRRLSVNTRYHCLQHLRAFFQWLSTQQGYKSKISAEAISYLTLDRKTVRALSCSEPVKYPSMEYVKRLTSSIVVQSDIDQRDRALIAFLLLSGMRDKAVATLPLGCFDPATLEVRQRPFEGVDTKFGKSFCSYLVRFDMELVGYVLEWERYLSQVKLFGSSDPLFPRSKVAQGDGGLSFECQGIEPVFWRGTGAIRLMLRQRAEAAGLDYYYPHSFRHAHVHLALKHADNGEQVRAISQNLGHEHIATTLTSYGKLDQYRMSDAIQSLDFSGKTDHTLSETEARVLEKLLKKHQQRT